MSSADGVYLRCALCGHEDFYDRGQLQPKRLFDSGFRPQRCGECGREAAEPAPRPFQLTYNDRELLRKALIKAD